MERLLARAVAGRRLAPHAVHAPPTFTTEQNKTYDGARAGDRPPDGRDGPDPYWMLEEIVRHNGLARCPDCGQVLIAAHDTEIERSGFNFLVCWDLHHPYRLPADVVPCHEGCVVACGRALVGKSRTQRITPLQPKAWAHARFDAEHHHAQDELVPMREIEIGTRDPEHPFEYGGLATTYTWATAECPRCGQRVTVRQYLQTALPEELTIEIEDDDGTVETVTWNPRDGGRVVGHTRREPEGP